MMGRFASLLRFRQERPIVVATAANSPAVPGRAEAKASGRQLLETDAQVSEQEAPASPRNQASSSTGSVVGTGGRVAPSSEQKQNLSPPSTSKSHRIGAMSRSDLPKKHMSSRTTGRLEPAWKESHCFPSSPAMELTPSSDTGSAASKISALQVLDTDSQVAAQLPPGSPRNQLPGSPGVGSGVCAAPISQKQKRWAPKTCSAHRLGFG
mmetsp:Transcript_12849/g.30479  ORF Transcript_12849/g.30479 Transcript_12849/m.30479 type:complete len:209 (+) Transcript_12849:1202-1828(+)